MIRSIGLASALAIVPIAATAAPTPAHDCGLEPPEISALAPDVPTVVESGHGRLVLDNFFGLTGPAKMPADVVARLNAATNEVLAQPDIKKRLLELGVTTTPGTPAEFTTFVRNQVSALQPVVKSVRITL